MIKHAPGYHDGFVAGQLMLFFASRLRISWVLVMLLSAVKKRKLSKSLKEQDGQPLLNDDRRGQPLPFGFGVKAQPSLDHSQPAPGETTYEDDYYWRITALSQCFC